VQSDIQSIPADIELVAGNQMELYNRITTANATDCDRELFVVDLSLPRFIVIQITGSPNEKREST
jgi:hypothetical protein